MPVAAGQHIDEQESIVSSCGVYNPHTVLIFLLAVAVGQYIDEQESIVSSSGVYNPHTVLIFLVAVAVGQYIDERESIVSSSGVYNLHSPNIVSKTQLLLPVCFLTTIQTRSLLTFTASSISARFHQPCWNNTMKNCRWNLVFSVI